MNGALLAKLQPRAQAALAHSPVAALRELRVEQVADGLLLSGSVSSFYHKQLAQEAVRTVDRTVRIINAVRVEHSVDVYLHDD